MKKQAINLLGLTCVALLSLAPSLLPTSAAPREITVFGPKTYTRAQGKPTPVVDNFRVNNTRGTFTLIVLLKGGQGSAPYVVVTVTQEVADNTGPVITIARPSSGQVFASSPITVSGTVTDESGVSALSVNGTPPVVTNGAFSAQVPLNAGGNTINLAATDTVGNTSTASVQVFLDVSPPQLSITSPANGSATNQSTIAVTGTVTDDVAVAGVSVNGQPRHSTATRSRLR